MRAGRKRKPRKVTLKADFTGDHGTGTAAATRGTVVLPIKGDKNGTGQRRRIHILTMLARTGKLTQRQFQAGEAIELAYCNVEKLSSGGELKEAVQSSPKPDAAISRQVDVMSQLVYVKKAIPRAQLQLVEHVCEQNRALRTSGVRRALPRLQSALDRVADHLRY
jgi:hypothetical protein